MESESNDIIKVPRFNSKNGFQTTNTRSKMMSRIRGKNTKSEEIIRKMLWGLGVRYRKHDTKLPGKPDIVIRKHRLAIFVDGEFWHGHNWGQKKASIKTNRDFWIPKIERNMQRDRQNNILLAQQGWIVLRFWDQEVKKELGVCLRRILNILDDSVSLD